MRWKTKTNPESPFKHSDIRVVTRFALLPTKRPDGVTIWLEFYSQMQMYRTCERFLPGTGNLELYEWVDV